MSEPAFDRHYYDNAQRMGQVHAALFSNVMWLCLFMGASRTVEQYEELLRDVEDVERSAQAFVAEIRALIEARIEALR